MSNEVTFREAIPEDGSILREWLNDEKILQWFPMTSEPRELDDSIRVWMSYCTMGAVIVALMDGKPCGMSCLYIQTYQKLKHQSLFAIVVDPARRGQGIGTKLLEETMRRAKEKFKIEILHLEVYDGNPAIHLYERAGFKKYGEELRFIKHKDGSYRAKYLLETSL